MKLFQIPDRFVILLALTSPLWLMGGCKTSDVHLWPILDVAKGTRTDKSEAVKDEAEEAGVGHRVGVLWPIFELDTTGPKAKHAFRPIYSYDGTRRSGSIIWPVVTYRCAGETNRYLNVAPLYFGGRKNEKSWQHFFPLAGRFTGSNYNRYYILPYFTSTQDQERVRGLLVPPVLFGKDAGKNSSWGLILNYFYRNDWAGSNRVFWPFVYEWSKVTRKNPGDEDAGDPPTVSWNLLVLPFYYKGLTTDNSGVIEEDLYLLPLYHHSRDQTHQKRAFGLIPWIDFDDVHLTALWGRSNEQRKGQDHRKLEMFPFFSTERSGKDFEYKLPGLGLARWQNEEEHLGLHGLNQGWAWWPLFGYANGLDPDNLGSDDQLGWRALGGLAGYKAGASGYKLSLVYPFHKVSKKDGVRHHRFWPLYRYTKSETKTRFSALAEVFSYRHGPKLRGDWLPLLHPVTYQGTDEGDHDFRFLWKLIESRSVDRESTKALNPLFYSRSSPEDARFLFLSGLLGWGRDAERRFARLLWFLDIPLGQSDGADLTR